MRVVDGVTLDVTIKGVPHQVRYIGVEALADGEAATKKNKQLVSGQPLKLEKDQLDADGQGRLLRYVYGKTYMVNAELARLGYARAATAGPNTQYQELMTTMEQEARQTKRGLWATVTATPAAARAAVATAASPTK